MSLSPLYRRALLQGGATVGCLAFVGLPGTSAVAATTPGAEPLAGALVGWLVIAPDGGGRIRLVEMDADSNPVRQVSEETIAPSAALAGVARQASAAAVRAAAASWQVPEAACTCAQGRIDHRQSGRTIPFTIWTDFV
jgi:hypothetical protein